MQVADRMMDNVLSGIYIVDGRVPSVRETAAEVAVNANTVMRSYEWLQSHQIIYNRRGIGYYVSPGAPDRIREMRRQQFFDDEAAYFFSRLDSFGVTPEQLADMYLAFINNSQTDR